MTEPDVGPTDRTGGRRLVLVLYVLLVCVGGAAGVLVSVFVEGLSAPRLFGLVALPVSAAGFAAYGALTVAVLLGVPLLLVAYVSMGIDDAPNDR